MIQSNEEFEARRSRLKKFWATSERLGQPVTEAQRIWGLISLELEFSSKPLSELEGIAWDARKWVESKNPLFIDRALLRCREAEIEPPSTLMKLVLEAASLRYDDLQRPGSSKSLRNDEVKAKALHLIGCLHIAGLPVEKAAGKVAQFTHDHDLGKAYKASSLEAFYSQEWRCGNPSIESLLREGFDRASEEVRAFWRKLANEMPDADEEVIGNRRD